jgi:hypothetical protein
LWSANISSKYASLARSPGPVVAGSGHQCVEGVVCIVAGLFRRVRPGEHRAAPIPEGLMICAPPPAALQCGMRPQKITFGEMLINGPITSGFLTLSRASYAGPVANEAEPSGRTSQPAKTGTAVN